MKDDMFVIEGVLFDVEANMHRKKQICVPKNGNVPQEVNMYRRRRIVP